MNAGHTPGPNDGAGKLDLLRQMVAADIEREGATSSFMVRAGLLADILDERAELLEALEYVRANLGDPVPIGRRHVARKVDAALSHARGQAS